MQLPSEVSSLVGQTIYKINGGQNEGELYLYTTSGYIYMFHHDQDCCESVYIEDICGELDNLLGHPLLTAEARSSEAEEAFESGTWTFYEFATIKGSVTIRWLGESNGYYSESVDLHVSIDKPLMSKNAPELLI